MRLLIYLLFSCIVCAALATPTSSDEKATLVGRLVENVEMPVKTMNDLISYSLPTPIQDTLCPDLQEFWNSLPKSIQEKINQLKESYPKKDSAACMWSSETSPREQGSCFSAKYYTVVGKRRYCCPPELKKAPDTYVRGNELKCVC